MFASFKSDKTRNTQKGQQENHGLTLLDTPNLDLCLRTPASLEEIVDYGKLILEGKGLLMCLNDLPDPDKIRAQDYLAGVAYTIGAPNRSCPGQSHHVPAGRSEYNQRIRGSCCLGNSFRSLVVG